jgi:hypothetical protein
MRNGARTQILPPQSFAEIPAGSLDLGQELAEFDRAVTLVAAADDVAGGDIQTFRIPTPASPQILFRQIITQISGSGH